MYSGLRLIPLETRALATASRYPIQLSPLPARYRVRGLLLRFILTVTQGAGAVAISGNALSRLVASLVVGKRIRGTGMLFDRLGWLMAGKDFSTPPGVPAAAGAYSRIVELYVPFSDLHQVEQLDTAPGARMFSDESLEMETGDFVSLYGANTTVAGTQRTYAVAEPFDGAVVAAPTRINYIDWTGKDVLLPAGTYSHIFLFKEDGTGVTSAEVTAVSIEVDGEQVAARLGIDDIAALWNLHRASGAGNYIASDTAPTPGEELTSEPGAAAGAGGTVTMEVVPLIVTPPRYKLTHLLHAESQVKVSFEGSATSFRIGYRQVEETSDDNVARAVAKLGVPHLDASRPKTAKGTLPSDARHRRLLPKRVGKVE